MNVSTSHSDQDSQFCHAVTRRRARNFYYGLKLLPEPKSSALYAVYTWMRAADDLVDNNGNRDHSIIVSQLNQFRERTEAALHGKVVGSEPIWNALSNVAGQYDLSCDAFHAVLDGQMDDLSKRSYDLFDELRVYCERVASSVGLICISIWGYTDPRARSLAVDRGIAFQLTNILRDFSEDYDANRVYLPQEDFRHHELTPSDLRRWSNSIACDAFIERQVKRAEEFYDQSSELDELISTDCRPTLWTMTHIYRRLLSKIARHPGRISLGRKIRVGSLTKAATALRARLNRMRSVADIKPVVMSGTTDT